MDDVTKKLIHQTANHLLNLLIKEVNKKEQELSGIAILLTANEQYEIKLFTTQNNNNAEPL